MPALGQDVDLYGKVSKIVFIVQDAHLRGRQLARLLVLRFVHLKIVKADYEISRKLETIKIIGLKQVNFNL